MHNKMGSTKKQAKHVPRVAPTPMVNARPKISAVSMTVDSAAPVKSAAVSAADSAKAATTAAAAAGGGTVLSRQEQVAALPRMGTVTKLKPARTCKGHAS